MLTRRVFGSGIPALAQETKVIEGEILYPERIALPDGAQIELSLQDVSRADAPATIVSSAMMPAGPGSPIPFRMTLSGGALYPAGHSATQHIWQLTGGFRPIAT